MVIREHPPQRETWAGRRILDRIPHVSPGEAFIVQGAAGTPAARNVLMVPPSTAALPILGERTLSAYTHEEELPFEIEDMVVDVTPAALVNGANRAAPPDEIENLFVDGQSQLEANIAIDVVRDGDRDANFVRPFTPYRATIMFDPETGLWILDEPYVIIPGKGVVIRVEDYGSSFVGTDGNTYNRDRAAITLRGSLLVLGERV